MNKSKDKKDLQVQFDQLTASSKDTSELSTLYQNTKDRIAWLTEVLTDKEVELRDAKKESLDSRERLNSLQAELVKKADLITSLENDLSFLNSQIAKKEEEKKLIAIKLTQAEAERAKAEKKFNQQQTRLKEMDLLYASLGNQIVQISDVLSEREIELGFKEQEISSLKEEIDTLNSRSAKLQVELIETKKRQSKTQEDLVAAIRLNAALQERMTGVSQSLESPLTDIELNVKEQQKAEELRRKIKVILKPEN